MNERVFVTGVGAVSPVGLDTTNTWNNLVTGQSGVDFISSFETDGFETNLIFSACGGLKGRKTFQNIDFRFYH